MTLRYKDESILNPQGITCRVLDVTLLDFSNAPLGRKSALTRLRCAQGGECIETKNTKGEIESVYLTQKGDAIFINPHDTADVYVPAKADGTRLAFADVTKNGYDIVGKATDNDDLLIKSNQTAKILHEIIQTSTCIKDAWGQGAHQFLFTGASLKLSADNHVTGIDKTAFDHTWELLETPSPIASKSTNSPKF
jgi:hypothetical protein